MYGSKLSHIDIQSLKKKSKATSAWANLFTCKLALCEAGFSQKTCWASRLVSIPVFLLFSLKGEVLLLPLFVKES